MTEQRVSSRYAHAVLNAATQEGLLDKVYEDLNFVKMVVSESSDLYAMMRSPVIHAWQKEKGD